MRDILLEQPLTILLAGGLVFIILLIMGLRSGQSRVLTAAGLVFAVTCVLLVIERLVETPREEIRRTLSEIEATVNQHDLDALLTYIHSSATQVSDDARRYYHEYQVQEVRITSVQDVRVLTNDAAEADFIVRVNVNEDRTGKGFVFVLAKFKKEMKRWKVIDYEWRSVEDAFKKSRAGES